MSKPEMSCRNPQHPPERPKTMLYLESKENAHVFACEACKEVNGVLSVQVVTDQKYKRHVYDKLSREGKLLTTPPPTQRRFTMDESLRRK